MDVVKNGIIDAIIGDVQRDFCNNVVKEDDDDKYKDKTNYKSLQ